MACRVEFFLKIVKQASSLDKDMRVLHRGWCIKFAAGPHVWA